MAILNQNILNQNITIYIMFQLVFVSVQRAAQTSIRIFLQNRILVDDAKFNSHDSGSNFKKLTFKNGYLKKNSYIFVTELKL